MQSVSTGMRRNEGWVSDEQKRRPRLRRGASHYANRINLADAPVDPDRVIVAAGRERRGDKISELSVFVWVERPKYARIWGAGTFDGQMVQREHVLADGDVLELHA